MYLFLSLVAFCILTIASSSDVKKEDNVLVLTKDNFDDTVKINKYVLVEFYAPWCTHCKSLAPEYANAAGKLAEENSDIQLAKVDATEETELAEKHKIKGYPTLKFYRDGTPVDYTGGRTADAIVKWLKKKTGPPAIQLKTVDEAKEFKESSDVAIIGFFKDQESKEAKEYLDVAFAVDDHPFGITSDESIYKEFKVEEDTVVLFKKFDEGRVNYEGEIEKDSIKNFIRTNSLPLVIEFTHKTAQKIFGGDVKLHNLLFISKKSEEYEAIIDKFRTAAKDYKGKVLFVSIDVDDEDHGKIIEFFGLKKGEEPTMRLIKLEEEMTKYKPLTTELTEDGIRNFVQDVLDGKIKQHLLSQDLSEDWNKGPVYDLVSKNFDEVVFDKSKDVIVEFYAPWCGHCKQLTPIYEKLGEKYKDRDDLIITRMDATANELEHTKVNSFPTIKLYKKGTNEVVEYNGERTMEGISKFLETDGEYGRAAPDEVIEYKGERTFEALAKFIDGGGVTEKEPEKKPEETDSKKDEL